MDAEGQHRCVSDAKLLDIIAQLERTLAELDDLGLSRIAITVSEAVELAKAARIPLRSGPES